MRLMIPVIPALMLLSSCSETAAHPKKHTLEISEKALVPALRQPVIAAPKVLVCYVPSHTAIGENILVGDHFVFIKIRESHWVFNLNESESDPFESLPSKPIDASRALTPFRSDAIVPYWDEKQKEKKEGE